MEEEQFEEALRNWNNGNTSDMEKCEVIAVAVHFELLYNQLLEAMDKKR